MAQILTNYPPEPRKVNEYQSECPQLKIPVRIEYYNRIQSYSGFVAAFWFEALMQVSYKFFPYIHGLNESKRIVAVWRLKELKPQRMTFEEQEEIRKQFKDKYTL